MKIKYLSLLMVLAVFSGCGLGSSSKYDLAVNEDYQIQQKKLADFESKRVQQELSSWQ